MVGGHAWQGGRVAGGTCGGGMHGGGHVWQGGHGGVRGKEGRTRQEKGQLQLAVRILLEFILVKM